MRTWAPNSDDSAEKKFSAKLFINDTSFRSSLVKEKFFIRADFFFFPLTPFDIQNNLTGKNCLLKLPRMTNK